MEPRYIANFESIIRSGKYPQFACFQLSTSMLIKCTICDAQINFVDAHHLTQHLKSNKHKMQDEIADKLLWYKEIEAMYKNTSTGSEYMRYNKQFQKWFVKNYGKTKILERHAREYVSIFIEEGKSTQTLIAALKFRFNYCERLGFNFKGLLKQSESLNTHKFLSAEDRQSIDQSLSNNLSMQVACRLLYDLAARCQDLLQFKFNMFIPNGDGATIEFIPKKTKKSKVTRSGVISKETFDLLKKLQLLTYASSDEFIYKQTEKQLKDRFYKLFKRKLKIEVQSHDFRHSRITDLFKQNMSVNAIQKYVGHLQSTTTLRYINIGKDEAVEQVKNLSSIPLPRQRESLEEEKQAKFNVEEQKSEDELPQSITLKVIRQKKRKAKKAGQMTLHDLMAFTQIAEVFERRHEAGKRQMK
ncbi:integrase family protein [Stylonychia lemnae]|uniref:Integrase family protein n=1 Tax=Stylonychia lemnae TaxID=5949 RepID=A0A078ALN8_STYLE|nr:integrase family protein [Stylonychia lemnae]|eukprot:CDW82327.1 integrase family protein [Stylonychia lemnae]